jgi:hypothetical protein
MYISRTSARKISTRVCKFETPVSLLTTGRQQGNRRLTCHTCKGSDGSDFETYVASLRVVAPVRRCGGLQPGLRLGLNPFPVVRGAAVEATMY